MTDVSDDHDQAPRPVGHPEEAVVDLLAALAYGELSAFERLAEDATLAPTLSDKASIAGMAAAEFGHFQRIAARLLELGVDPDLAMEPFVAPLDAFHVATQPIDWLTGLIKAYVGDGIAADFYREVAAYVDEPTRELVLEVLRDTGHAAFAVERVRAAIASDPHVAGRLALWARRLVGEAMVQAQRVAVDREALARLLVGGAGDLAEFGQMLARITAKHSERMSALGLSP
jgi:tRNA-(MS[2]IO[6]A)-hydroxylase (MiaE)-like